MAELGLEPRLRPLLDHLGGPEPAPHGSWRDWQIGRITGGRNNRLYRIRGPGGDFVVKFTVPDGRDRAGREFESQCAVQRAGLAIAPEPVLVDREAFLYPVIVSTWVEGTVSDRPPGTDDGWRDLVQHLALVHSVTPPAHAATPRPPTIHAATAAEGIRLVREQLIRLPGHGLPDSQLYTHLRVLLHKLETRQFPEWPAAPVALCRLDNNIANFVRRPGQWASVDWEYSGWGDPAFDVANLVTHVSTLGVPAHRWQWVIDTYCSQVEDEEAALRIQAYRDILLVWWAARLTRYLHEIPQGRDKRLVPWPEGWEADVRDKYKQYVQLAERTLS